MIKNITKNLLLVLFAGMMSFQAQSQGMKERAADKLYDQLAFFKASESGLSVKNNANSAFGIRPFAFASKMP